MPLQQLVEYFNDRLQQEHNNSLRPFLLDNGTVHGLFGPIRVGSVLSPIRASQRHSQTLGQIAQLTVTPNTSTSIPSSELHNWVESNTEIGSTTESIINFDRLTRAVHMLNYLPQAHLDEVLFLEVDPRHILGIKQDHGAYFEEVINKCGLQTGNVAIVLSISNAYSHFYPLLLKALQNYQRRGYKLALKFDYQALEKSAAEFITRAAPDFVGISALELDRVRDSQLIDKLQHLTTLVTSLNARTILLTIDDKQYAALARKTGFDLVQGSYFEQISSQPLHSNTTIHYQPNLHFA